MLNNDQTAVRECQTNINSQQRMLSILRNKLQNNDLSMDSTPTVGKRKFVESSTPTVNKR